MKKRIPNQYSKEDRLEKYREISTVTDRTGSKGKGKQECGKKEFCA